MIFLKRNQPLNFAAFATMIISGYRMYRIKLPVASFFKVMLLVWLAFAQLFILAKIKKNYIIDKSFK